jgi:hypothetical protein
MNRPDDEKQSCLSQTDPPLHKYIFHRRKECWLASQAGVTGSWAQEHFRTGDTPCTYACTSRGLQGADECTGQSDGGVEHRGIAE